MPFKESCCCEHIACLRGKTRLYRKVCQVISGIPGEVFLLDLQQEEQADPKNYDTVIVGGSVYMGKIRKEAAAYCRVHKQQLLKKKLGLFIYCANSEKAEEQAEGAYPAELLQHAAAVAYFGYAFYFERLNFLEKAVVRVVAGANSTREDINTEAMERMCTALYGDHSNRGGGKMLRKILTGQLVAAALTAGILGLSVWRMSGLSGKWKLGKLTCKTKRMEFTAVKYTPVS